MKNLLFFRIPQFTARIPQAWKFAGVIWLGTRIFLLLWGALIWKLTLDGRPMTDPHFYYYSATPVNSGAAGALVGVWQRWDTIYYQQIAQFGYAQTEWSVFFPLYPLLAAGLSRLTGISTLSALLVISNLACYGFLVLIYRLADEQFGVNAARAATATAVLLPTSFFFFSGYPQSLGLLLTLLAYDRLRHKHWLAAFVSALLAGLAHSTVFPLALLLAWEVRAVYRPPWSLKNLPVALIPIAPMMGTALFFAYRIALGMPSFSGLQAQIWRRTVQPPWQSIARLLDFLLHRPFSVSIALDALSLVFTLVCLVLGWKRLRRGEWVYYLAFLCFLLITSVRDQPLESYGRFLLLGFPIYLLLGQFASRSKAFRLAGFTIGVSLQVLLSAVFFVWGWVD